MRIMHISRASIMICQFLIPLIETQKKQGHYVCVCASDDYYAQKMRDIGIDVFVHKLKRNLNPFSIIKAIFQIKRILIEEKIDVAICHTPIGAGVGRIAARMAKVPNIVYIAHGTPFSPGQNIIIWHLWFYVEKILGFITDAILTMNSDTEKLCKNHRLVRDRDKIFRIPGIGVNLEKFKAETTENERQQIEKELGIGQRQKILLCTAFLIPTKGIFVLLEAAKEICSQRDDVSFLLAGMGPYMEKLKSRRNSYNLQEKFKILGWRDDVNRLMRAADVFVLPTYYPEGLPVSILEAMACGKPVVATKHRGCEDVVVDGQTGFLTPIKQVSPLVDKLLLLLDNETLRRQMGQAGRQRVEQHFELNYCTDKIIEALDKVIH